MQYAARLPSSVSRRTILVPLIALLVGAAAASGAYLITDNDVVRESVIVVEAPAAQDTAVNEAATAAAIAGSSTVSPAIKNEAATATAISRSGTVTPAIKDEAATAAAISGSGIELRGSTASRSGTTSPSGQAESAETRVHAHAARLGR